MSPSSVTHVLIKIREDTQTAHTGRKAISMAGSREMQLYAK